MNEKIITGRKLKRVISIMLALAMVLTLVPMNSMTVYADSTTVTVGSHTIEVPNGVNQSNVSSNPTQITDSSENVTLNDGWYIVTGEVNFDSGCNLIIDGDVNIILNSESYITVDTLIVNSGKNLTFWGVTNNPGSFYPSGHGIEINGTMIVNGGTVETTLAPMESMAAVVRQNGNITVNGGTFSATSFGNNNKTPGINCTNGAVFTVNGGVVSVTGNADNMCEEGADGMSGSGSLIINGGTTTIEAGNGNDSQGKAVSLTTKSFNNNPTIKAGSDSNGTATSYSNQRYLNVSYTPSTTPISGTVAITGTAKVGQTLTASYTGGNSSDVGTNLTYKWYRDTTEISGATSSTYTLVAADKDHTINVKITGTGSYSGDLESTATATVTSDSTLTDAMAAKVGKTSASEIVKGATITIDSKSYLVLSVEGTKVKVLAKYDATDSQKFDSSSNAYFTSAVDTYLTDTYYNSLSFKDALVDTSITQYKYSYNSNVYNDTTHTSYVDYSTKAEVATQNRKVFLLDVADIEEYFNNSYSTTNVQNMFASSGYYWLRSADADDVGSAFNVSGYDGCLGYSNVNFDDAVRPAFVIDLSLFSSTATVTVNSDGHGSISQSSVSGVANNTNIVENGNLLVIGNTVITATSNTGYMFNSWTGIPENGKVTEDITVCANFVATSNPASNWNQFTSTSPTITLDNNNLTKGAALEFINANYSSSSTYDQCYVAYAYDSDKYKLLQIGYTAEQNKYMFPDCEEIEMTLEGIKTALSSNPSLVVYVIGTVSPSNTTTWNDVKDKLGGTYIYSTEINTKYNVTDTKIIFTDPDGDDHDLTIASITDNGTTIVISLTPNQQAMINTLTFTVVNEHATKVNDGAVDYTLSSSSLTCDAECGKHTYEITGEGADKTLTITGNDMIVGDCGFRKTGSKYDSSVKKIVIVDATQIQSSAFRDCENVTEVTIPSTVTFISKSFDGCSSLNTIRFNATSLSSVNFNGSFGVASTGSVYVNGQKLTGYSADVDKLIATNIPEVWFDRYKITSVASTNGSFKVKYGTSEVTSATENSEIIIAPTADSGYEVDKVEWKKSSDSGYTTITNNNGYKFTMPAEAVSVKVSFKASSVTYEDSITLTSTNLTIGKKPSEVSFTGYDEEKMDLYGYTIIDSSNSTVNYNSALTAGDYCVAIILKAKDNVLFKNDGYDNRFSVYTSLDGVEDDGSNLYSSFTGSGYDCLSTGTATDDGQPDKYVLLIYAVSISPSTPTHTWIGSVGTGTEANKLIVSCDGTSCSSEVHNVSLTLTANSPTYSGSAVTYSDDGSTADIKLTGKIEWIDAGFNVPTVKYYSNVACTDAYKTSTTNGGATADYGAPKNAGEYYATISYTNTDESVATAKVKFEIKKATPSQTTTPTLLPNAETISGKQDGTITGLTTAMEYRLATETNYSAVENVAMTFAPGTYKVRCKETANYEAGADATVVIDAGRKLTVTLPSTQTGYTVSVDNAQNDWHATPTITFTMSNGYWKTDAFKVKVNGTEVTLSETDTYTLPAMEEDATVTVEGLAFDEGAPVIRGIENNRKYCEKITFTVTDEYLATVKANDIMLTPEDGKYTLPSFGTVYNVVATDQAGNSATVTSVKMTDGHDFSGEPTISGDKKIYICENGCGTTKVEYIPVTPEEKPFIDPSAGDVEKDAEVAKDSPIREATIDNTKKSLVEATGIFTDSDKEAIQNGADARVWMEINKVDETQISSEEMEKINEKATALVGENPQLIFFDASLFKKVGDAGEPTQIHEPGTEIEVTIKIPTDLLNHDKTMVRNYSIVRMHNGVAEIITGTFNEETNEFTFKTDKFSTYALGYTDAPAKVAVTEVTVKYSTVKLTKKGETAQIVVTVEPENATDKAVTYESSDENVAMVDRNGKITAVANGTATITVKVDGKMTTVKVTIEIPKTTEQNPEDKPVVPATTESPTTETTVKAEEVEKELGKDKETAQQITKIANENNVSIETLKITDETVKAKKDDKDVSGSSFGLLQARATKMKNTSFTLTWTKVKNADGYMIYGNRCNSGGKKYQYKLVKTVGKDKTSLKIKKLKKGTYYKYMIVAYKNVTVNGKTTKVTLAASKTCHATTTGGKYGVAKSVKVAKIGSKKISTQKNIKTTLKVGKTAKIKASEVRQIKSKKIRKHRAICYESSNTSVVTVSDNGKIKAVGKGKATVYVYAQNGVYKKITVTVK